jgi:hypothetical protein
MYLAILTLLTALSISAVAIYYSVAGLVAIFSAAAIPIVIMGSVLEIGKLVTAVWLHKYWKETVWWLKTYLSAAVVVLMFITSMGIFGFLSSAHIEQTANATENIARVEQIDAQIDRKNSSVEAAELRVDGLQNSGSTQDSQIQAQIDAEQRRIDTAYERVQPAIDDQNDIISKEEQRLGGSLNLFQTQLNEIDTNLKNIEQFIASDRIAELQALIGVEADGNLGPATSRAIDAYRVSQNLEKQRLVELISQESSKIQSPVIDAAREEIRRLRGVTESEIANSSELINRLRQQLGTVDRDQIATLVAEQETIITQTQKEIAELTEQKFQLETEYRKLEAEVGPIKYIAEFVYGSADNDLLEEAVRWVIVIIIFVFDPLAVLLLIASQYTFESQRKIQASVVLATATPAPNPKASQETSTFDTNVNNIADDVVNVDQKKNIKYSDELSDKIIMPDETSRLQEWNQKEEILKDAKNNWKEDHPDKTIKFYKTLFINGKIDKLPWENEKYIQNSEQTDTSLFKKIQDARKNE